MDTSPWLPAPSPEMALVTMTVPGSKEYSLITVASTPSPAGMVSGSGSSVATPIVSVAPLTEVSAVVPAGTARVNW